MMVKNMELSLSEQFVILEILCKKLPKNKRVKLVNGKIYSIALIFVELFSDNKIAFDENNKVIFLNTELTKVEFKDIILQTIISKKSMNLNEWIKYFSSHNKLSTHIYNSIIESLINKGVLELISSNSYLASSKKSYFDSKKIGDFLIEIIKTELLENDSIDEDILHLTFLLESNKMLIPHVSEYEHNTIKGKLLNIYENNYIEDLNIIKKSIGDTTMFSLVKVIIDTIEEVA